MGRYFATMCNRCRAMQRVSAQQVLSVSLPVTRGASRELAKTGSVAKSAPLRWHGVGLFSFPAFRAESARFTILHDTMKRRPVQFRHNAEKVLELFRNCSSIGNELEIIHLVQFEKVSSKVQYTLFVASVYSNLDVEYSFWKAKDVVIFHEIPWVEWKKSIRNCKLWNRMRKCEMKF